MQVNDKKSLRAFYRNKRHEMPAHVKKVQDLKIFENLKRCEDYKKSKTVLAYVSSQIEVDTFAIISYSWKSNKQVLVPKCVPDTNLMDFYEIKSFDDLEKGAFGILEPKINCKKITSFDDSSCCLVPALTYDKKGYRLGFGKGFYDRFLVDYNGRKIGLCYSSCISDKLPVDEFDKRVDCLVTDIDITVL